MFLGFWRTQDSNVEWFPGNPHLLVESRTMEGRSQSHDSWEESKLETQVRSKAESMNVTFLILLVVCWVVTPVRLFSQPASIVSSAKISTAGTSGQDPDKPASELNHHLAGYALIAIGMLVIAARSSSRLRPLQYAWPFLFVAAGLFLAAWSDKEMWPRGNLSWTWLIHHDAEARQHKIYAVLLMVMGIIEYLRVNAKLNRFWQTWSFPALALAGIVLLLFHDHTAASGASSPEARNYMVYPLLDGTTKAVASENSGAQPVHDHRMMYSSAPLEAQQTQLEADGNEEMDRNNRGNGHQHHMTAEMVKVEHQHLWFAVVGFAVVLFKVIYDSKIWHRSIVPFLWPTGVAVLGILLVFYTE
jgi:hypothetical protein